MSYRAKSHAARGLRAAVLISALGVLSYAQEETPKEADAAGSPQPAAAAASVTPDATAAKPEATSDATAAPEAPKEADAAGSPQPAAPAASVTPAAAAAPEAPVVAAGPVRVKAGSYTAESRGPWTAQDRLSARPPELWAAYMHGVVDFFAKPSSWEELLADGQAADGWLDATTTLRGNPYRACPMPSLRLAGKQELVTGKALITATQLRELAGRTVRVFVWVSAKESGQEGYLWAAAPRLDLVLTNAAGRAIVTVPGAMATRGSFPWHCYYRDVVVPEPSRQLAGDTGTTLPDGGKVARAGGLYLRACNPASGTAWFSTPAWEVVDPARSYALADIQDPTTGSAAPNPRYDELPVHLSSPQICYRGVAPAYEWAFLGGANRGATGVPTVLEKGGLDAYLSGTARRDPHHLMQGLARLPEWVHTGATFACLPAADADLLAFLGNRMVAAQEAESGFWGYEKEPRSMAVTAAVVQRMFGGDAFARADRPLSPQPWLACGDLPLPNPERIVKTVLGLQGDTGNKQRTKGGWSALATHCASPEQIAAETSCSLAASADAIFLLRRCAEGQAPALQARRDRAVREAIEQIWAACLLPTGLWKQSSSDLGPTTGGVLARLLEASPLLEFRTDLAMASPRLAEEVTADQGVVKIRCPTPTAGAVGVRIYMVPEDVPSGKLSDQYLAGMVQASDGSDVRAMDPLAAALSIRRQGRVQWGASGFEEYGYTTWKLSLIPAALPISFKSQPVSIVLPKEGKVLLYACNVNAYGETSRPLAIRVKMAENVEAPAPAAAVEPEAKAAVEPTPPSADVAPPPTAPPTAPVEGTAAE